MVENANFDDRPVTSSELFQTLNLTKTFSSVSGLLISSNLTTIHSQRDGKGKGKGLDLQIRESPAKRFTSLKRTY